MARTKTDTAKVTIQKTNTEDDSVEYKRRHSSDAGSSEPGTSDWVLKIEKVAISDNFQNILGGSIDSPVVGECFSGYAMTITGWVLGLVSPVMSAKIRHAFTNMTVTEVCEPRSDVFEFYPAWPEAEFTGFQASILSVGLPPKFQLDIVVTFEDGRDEILGSIWGVRKPMQMKMASQIQPLFLVFVGRCGSTLIMKLLSQIPEIVMTGNSKSLYEVRLASYYLHALNILAGRADYRTSFLEDLRKIERFYYFKPELIDQETINWCESEQVRNTANWIQRQICQYYESAVTRQNKPGARYFLEKMFADRYERFTAMEVFPIVKQVLNVRHPYDVMASLKSFQNLKLDEEQFCYRRQLFLSIVHSLKTLGDEVFLLRYEDLINNPHMTLTDLLNYLVLENDPGMLTTILESSENLAAELGQHITSQSIQTSVGRWKHDIKDRKTLGLCHLYFDDLLEQLGYSV